MTAGTGTAQRTLTQIRIDGLFHELVRHYAARMPDRLAFIFLKTPRRGDTQEQSLTYAVLDRRARAIAAALQARCNHGGRVLLLFPPGLAYIEAFVACLYAGVTAVPLYPPRANQKGSRVEGVAADCDAELVLTCADMLPAMTQFCAARPSLANLPLLAADQVSGALADEWRRPPLNADDLAFLQYTSGSTGEPKGVMVSHGNLMANQSVIGRGFGTRSTDVALHWLPMYHDMGLIGAVLHPLYAGFLSVLMSPVAFIQDPVRWLEAISRFRASVGGAPDFAYALLCQRITPERLAGLDLSSWRLAFSGAEPVRPQTLAAFAKTFGGSGFSQEQFFPCYGMAEATLFISGGPGGRKPTVEHLDAEGIAQGKIELVSGSSENQRAMVGCGRVPADHQVRIVDPETCRPAAADAVGEIWFSGPSVAGGYWGQPELTQAAFHARIAGEDDRKYLRTGDLGFMRDGAVFITGRLKDLMIFRGRNVYPQDVELVVSTAHPALRPGQAAAFAVDEDGESRLAVVIEVNRKALRKLDGEAVAEAVREAVARECQLRLHGLVLVKPGAVEKTTSGKVRRFASRKAFLANRLPGVVFEQVETARVSDGPAPGEIETMDPAELAALAKPRREWRLAAYVRLVLADLLGLEPVDCPLDKPLTALGLDSMTGVSLQHRLETDLSVVLPLQEHVDSWTAQDLVTALANELAAGPREVVSASSSVPNSLALTPNQRALFFCISWTLRIPLTIWLLPPIFPNRLNPGCWKPA